MTFYRAKKNSNVELIQIPKFKMDDKDLITSLYMNIRSVEHQVRTKINRQRKAAEKLFNKIN